MTTTEVVKGRWYPMGPPALPGESDDDYTNRLTGASGPDGRPYDHSRNRQCSINYHVECSDREHSGQCECPCHDELRNAKTLVAEFNATTPVGTVVEFVEGCVEPPVASTGLAYVDASGWPVVDLDTFPDPVKLSWLRLPQ